MCLHSLWGGVLIGNNVGISSSCLWCTNSITIGNNVKIGANSVIIDNDAHSLDYNIRRDPSLDVANSKPIIIEDDVLIGTGSIILKGVTIGARSIIGAGSVVTKNIPSNCIAAGNPCKRLKDICAKENDKN
jgi:acetyltransferase-like isoleucine patch superfamily enzyme